MGGKRIDASRRMYLSGLAGGLTGLTFGPGAGESGDPGADIEVPLPEVTSPRIDAWREVERSERTFAEGVAFASVSGRSVSRIYARDDLRALVREETGVAFDRALATFFATRIGLRGLLTGLASASVIGEQIATEFVDRLERRGVTDVRAVPSGRPRPAVDGSEFYEYRGRYPVSNRARESEAGADTAPERRWEASAIPVVGFFSVWKRGTAAAYAGGGAYPVWTTLLEAADGSRPTDTLRPRRLRRDLVALVESVE